MDVPGAGIVVRHPCWRVLMLLGEVVPPADVDAGGHKEGWSVASRPWGWWRLWQQPLQKGYVSSPGLVWLSLKWTKEKWSCSSSISSASVTSLSPSVLLSLLVLLGQLGSTPFPLLKISRPYKEYSLCGFLGRNISPPSLNYGGYVECSVSFQIISPCKS